MDPLLLPSQRGLKSLSDDDDDDDDMQNVPSLQEEPWRLRIKSLKDVNILVKSSDTIAAVKEAVRQALGPDVTKDRPYTRLVCKGRLLAPDAAVLRDLKSVVQPDDVVHAVLSASAPREGPQAALQRGMGAVGPSSSTTTTTTSSSLNSPTSPNSSSARMGTNRRRSQEMAAAGPSRRAWRGAGINAAGLAVRQTADSDDDDDDDDDGDDTSVEDLESGGWMGLDRLRQAGLRRSDVVALRTYFGRSIDRFVRQNPEQTTFASETDPRRRRLLQEEAWMAAQGPLSEFRLNTTPLTSSAGVSWGSGGGSSSSGGNGLTSPAMAGRATGLSPSEALWRSGGLSAAVGTDRDFIWGFLLGFLVGLLMLVWVWMPSVPHKQKLGILTGISFQLALSMLRSSGGVDEDQYPIYEGDDLFFNE